jgi:hypothetical protein
VAGRRGLFRPHSLIKYVHTAVFDPPKALNHNVLKLKVVDENKRLNKEIQHQAVSLKSVTSPGLTGNIIR